MDYKYECVMGRSKSKKAGMLGSNICFFSFISSAVFTKEIIYINWNFFTYKMKVLD